VSDLTTVPALELARRIREREVSAVDVVEAHLERIAAVNPSLNAVVAINDGARASAAMADEAIADRAELGPLHGVPFTVKDIIETYDLPTVVGMPERRHSTPTRDAPVVAGLRRAGAILLGKTNCPYGGGGLETFNDVFGRTNNPYDVERTPAGSSGGEAAIIGAGGSPFGLGTDSGGSVRLPAHFCGIATIKPTAGLLSVDGVLDDDGPIGPTSDPRTQVGILARSATDLGPILTFLTDDPDGWETAPVPLAASDGVNGLRVGVIEANGLSEPTPETRAAIRSAADALADGGALVGETTLPEGGHEITEAIWRSYGRSMSAADVYLVLRRWDAYRRTMAAFMSGFDLLLSPVFPVPAVRHGETDGPELEAGISYTTPYSLVGWPCAVVRAGWSPEGLPIGVQLVARPWRDHVAIRAAVSVEEVSGGWSPPGDRA
jgi:amidase